MTERVGEYFALFVPFFFLFIFALLELFAEASPTAVGGVKLPYTMLESGNSDAACVYDDIGPPRGKSTKSDKTWPKSPSTSLSDILA